MAIAVFISSSPSPSRERIEVRVPNKRFPAALEDEDCKEGALDFGYTWGRFH